ncbi:MAG: hypothetical protein ACE5FN_03910 [Leptospirillia bacterium]
MARKKQTDKVLIAASEQLHQQMRMLTVLVNALIGAGPGGAPTPVAEEALGAAFLARAAALIHFLHPDKPKRDDVIAVDFFEDPKEWERHCIAPSERLHLARERSRADAARLSYKSPGAMPKVDGRYVIEVANEISAGLSIFLAHAPAERLAPVWRRFRNE